MVGTGPGDICTYDEGRFKKAFRVSRETFDLILKSIRPDIEKKTSLLLAFLVLVNLISTSRNR